jgi:hypothetical protein
VSSDKYAQFQGLGNTSDKLDLFISLCAPTDKGCQRKFSIKLFTACILQRNNLDKASTRENGLISHCAPDPPVGIQMRKLLRQPISTDKGKNFRRLLHFFSSQRPLSQ